LDQDRAGVSASVRKVRRLVMDALKLFTSGHLGLLFSDGDLEQLDLFEMDFSDAHLESTSFRGCFVVCSSFRGSRLAKSCFAEASVRNVDFTGADLSFVDFTDADWFNAIGLTETQLGVARRATLKLCPTNITHLFRFLDDHYVYPFKSWPSNVQQQ